MKSRDLYPLANGFLSIHHRSMISADEIADRADRLAEDTGRKLPAKPRDALRKLRGSENLPSLPTLVAISEALSCSLAYLIGETDHPEPSVPLRRAQPEVPQTALRVGAGAIFRSSEVSLSIDAEEWGEVGFLLSEEDAVLLRYKLDVALHDLSDFHRRQRDDSSA